MHDLIPIVLFTGLFAMIFGIYYLRTRENMAMLEKGMNPRSESDRFAAHPFTSLKLGLLLAGAGLGLFVAYILDTLVFTGRSTDPLYPSLIGLGGGLGLIVCYLIEKKYWTRQGRNNNS